MSAITAGGDLVHYEVLGRGRPVILVHGWLGSWRYWIPTLQHLQSNYRLYALDLYGFGDSAKNPAKYNIEHQIALLEDFMVQLAITKAAFVGHGLGAIIAAEFARRYPDRVPRLIVVDAPLFDTGDLDRRAPLVRKVAARPTLPQPEVNPTAPTIMSASAAMRAALVEAARAKMNGQLPAELEEIAGLPADDREVYEAHNPLLPLMDGTTLELLLGRCFRRAEPNYEKLLVDVSKIDGRVLRRSVEHFDSGRMLDTLRLLNIPVVAIHGLEDPLMPPPRDEVLNYLTHEKEQTLVPVLLPNVRHFPMLEDERFPRMINDYLEAADISRVEQKERWKRRHR